MKRVQLSLLFSAILLIASCGGQNEKQQETEAKADMPQEQQKLQALYDEVIEIHDEVMPKMDDIMKAKGKLQEQLDTLRESNPEDIKIAALENTIGKLNKADEAMMNWMRNFKPQDDEKDSKKVLEYYKSERVKISEVKDEMLSAIDEANELIKKEE
ncbi:MAG: hypothetical protein AAF843_12450 [Bacteroidota bacterium]